MPSAEARSESASSLFLSSYAAVVIAARTLSERGTRSGCVRLFVVGLATDTADRGGACAQPPIVDVAAAVDAHPVGPVVEAPARFFQLAQLTQVARHLGAVELG